MIDFALVRPKSAADAASQAAASPTAQQGAAVRFVAGGTTLVDLMRQGVENPAKLVDLNRIGLDQIEKQPDGSLRVGAMVRNAALAHEPEVTAHRAVLAQAILAGASAQIRNMASTGGNLLQRTRCPYFRDPNYLACNKRNPGSGCAAIAGFNRTHAILGGSEHCIATHPSDMAVAMTALEAQIHIDGPAGARTIPIADFYRLPGEHPEIENALQPGELITHVVLPPPVAGTRSGYLKLRDRASYEFALASCAVILGTQGHRVTYVRIALGGVGTRPWRAVEAEKALHGKPVSLASFKLAAEAALAGAKPQSDNGYKVELARRCIVRALTNATAQA